MHRKLYQLTLHSLAAGLAGLISFVISPAVGQNIIKDATPSQPVRSAQSPLILAIASEPWPQEPITIGDNPLKAWIFLPKPGPPPNDPLQETDAGGQMRGKLIYIARIVLEDRPAAQHFFVFRGVGVTSTVAGQVAGVANYIASGGDKFFDPQFSPDSLYLVFKNGDPFFRYGGYQLYLWDFRAKQVRQVASSLSYPLISWSWDSSHLTYIEGGDMDGNETDFSGQIDAPLRLHVYNRRTGQNQIVAQDPQVISHAWTHQGTLLFTRLLKSPPDLKEKPADNAANAGAKDETPAPPFHPSIYEVSSEGGQPKLVVSNGYEPSPSPDGKWIAFLGWPAPARQEKKTKAEAKNKDETRLTRPSVYLFDRARNERIFVRSLHSRRDPMEMSPPFTLRWTPDSQRLLIAEAAYTARRAGPGQGTLGISVINVPPQVDKPGVEATGKELATLKAQDFETVLRSSPRPQFEPLEVTQDGKFLLIKISEYIGRDRGFLTELKSLQAVDLQNGSTSLVARIRNKWGSVIGWDWHDESASTANAAKSENAKTP